MELRKDMGTETKSDLGRIAPMALRRYPAQKEPKAVILLSVKYSVLAQGRYICNANSNDF